MHFCVMLSHHLPSHPVPRLLGKNLKLIIFLSSIPKAEGLWAYLPWQRFNVKSSHNVHHREQTKKHKKKGACSSEQGAESPSCTSVPISRFRNFSHKRMTSEKINTRSDGVNCEELICNSTIPKGLQHQSLWCFIYSNLIVYIVRPMAYNKDTTTNLEYIIHPSCTDSKALLGQLKQTRFSSLLPAPMISRASCFPCRDQQLHS